MVSPFASIASIILEPDPHIKCESVARLHEQFDSLNFESESNDSPRKIASPGYPETLQLVSPRDLKRRGIQSQKGRNILMHSIAHIEFNAINLALDAAYRFRNQARDYYKDWIGIAADEARHFCMIRDYLKQHGCEYGDFPAHNGLWQMAVDTQHDIVARMALVPRVLEARGLDVTPGIIAKLERVDDQHAVEILNIIYQDEIAHVDAGSRWFFYQCEQNHLEPRSTFMKMVEQYLHGELRGPFNISARLKAGFDEFEMASIDKRYG